MYSIGSNCCRLLWVAIRCYSSRSTKTTVFQDEWTTDQHTIHGHRVFREEFFTELNIREIYLCVIVKQHLKFVTFFETKKMQHFPCQIWSFVIKVRQKIFFGKFFYRVSVVKTMIKFNVRNVFIPYFPFGVIDTQYVRETPKNIYQSD